MEQSRSLCGRYWGVKEYQGITIIDIVKKYQEYKQIDYPKIGELILASWKENKIFEKSVHNREGAETFTFYEGPPSANGTPGIYHVMACTIKDIFCRYKTLKGFQVKRKGGWDTHGLPVELQVEKELGITKEDIGKEISVEEYNRKCRETDISLPMSSLVIPNSFSTCNSTGK